MPRGFLSESGIYEQYEPETTERFAKHHREIFCEKCQSTYSPQPLDPRKIFQYWECFGCYKQIRTKDIMNAMKKAAATIEQELPELSIKVLLGHVSIKSNILIGADRRTAKIQKLSPQAIFRVNSEMVKLVSEYLDVKVRTLRDLFVR
jgi:hypothetical protein